MARQSKATLMLAEFHATLGDEPGRGGADLRYTLHDEEHQELVDELTRREERPAGQFGTYDVRAPKADEDVDRAKLARELADVVYLAFGTAHAFDIDLDAALAEIHRAAMEKLDPPCPDPLCCDGINQQSFPAGEPCVRCGGSGKGERVVRNDGNILKPPGFVPPNMSGAVR
jgi:NTP pyrophosphatase (non-canonical NTP hydrolase)